MHICWFSCGVTSAVACKLAINQYHDVRIFFIATGSEHPDSFRFLHDCEDWFGVKIEIRTSSSFGSHWDVCESKRCINTPYGAPCTLELKKKVRYRIEDEIKHWDGQIFGFDCSERLRFARFAEQYPNTRAIAPLIDSNLSKPDCMGILTTHSIGIPQMYLDGFPNNNCVGCVKGGKGYWARIRKCYPSAFARMVCLENSVGHSCINGLFLRDLPDDYPLNNPVIPSCSLFCDPDFMDI